jgi:ABC-type bacteriocin/lantibiotic exporter with double-glycine peptidase domain
MDRDTKVAILFIIINFCVAYVSDNILNDLSKYSKIKAFKLLSPYFKKNSIVGAGIYAGLTVGFATLILMFLYKSIFNTYLPNTNSLYLFTSIFMVYFIFFVIAYLIGYAMDVFIYRMNVFDNLESFYKEVGAGNGGALSFVFSLGVSFIVLKMVMYLTH